MAQCITCGSELHPERAKKYDYCLAPECQEKNFKGLTMVAIGMNKAADELMILDDQTREDLASGKYRDQRRGFFGSLDPAAGRPGEAGTGSDEGETDPAAGAGRAGEPSRTAGASRAVPSQATTAASTRRPRPRMQPAPVRKPWTAKQERLAVLYNEQGLRPDEIGAKLGISAHLATQIVLAARNRRRA